MPRKYSRLLRTLCNPSIFRTLAYSKPWHMQNPDIFRTEVYSEPWDTQNSTQIQRWSLVQKILTAIVVFAIYKYFCNISFSSSLLFKNLIKVYFLLQKYLFYVKKHSDPEGRGPWTLAYPLHACNLLFIIKSLIKFILKKCKKTKTKNKKKKEFFIITWCF